MIPMNDWLMLASMTALFMFAAFIPALRDAPLAVRACAGAASTLGMACLTIYVTLSLLTM